MRSKRRPLEDYQGLHFATWDQNQQLDLGTFGRSKHLRLVQFDGPHVANDWARSARNGLSQTPKVAALVARNAFGPASSAAAARGRVDSRQQTDHAADGWREQGESEGGSSTGVPDLIRRETPTTISTPTLDPSSPPNDTHGRTLNQKLCCDVAASRANGTGGSLISAVRSITPTKGDIFADPKARRPRATGRLAAGP